MNNNESCSVIEVTCWNLMNHLEREGALWSGLIRPQKDVIETSVGMICITITRAYNNKSSLKVCRVDCNRTR